MKTRADAGAQEMEKEDMLDESDPTGYSTLSKEESTPMSKRDKAIALSCFIHNVGFRNLV